MRTFLFRLLFAAEYRQLEQEKIACIRAQADHADAQAARAGLLVKLDRLEHELERVRPKRPRFDRYRALTDEQLVEVLAGTASLPAIKAIEQLVDEHFQLANDAAVDPNLPDQPTKFHLGGAEYLLRLKAALQTYTERERKAEQYS